MPRPGDIALLPSLELPKILNLFQNMLQELLSPDHVEMPPYLGILASESIDFILRKSTSQSRVELPRKL